MCMLEILTLTECIQKHYQEYQQEPKKVWLQIVTLFYHLSMLLRPPKQQPTRLPHPWDSPGKNTGVGCHFLLQGMKVKSESEVPQSCPTLHDPMDRSPPGSSVHRIFQARVLEQAAIAFFPLKYRQRLNSDFFLSDTVHVTYVTKTTGNQVYLSSFIK